MSQHDYDIADATGSAFRADLNNIFAAILSENSGGVQPSSTAAYMWWADTASGFLKQRDAANNAWISKLKLSQAYNLVDNTADTSKPVSTAQQAALNLKANLSSPTLSGTPLAPTQAAGNNTTRIATTAFVQTAIPDAISQAEAEAGEATTNRLWTAQRVKQAISAQTTSYSLPDGYRSVDTYTCTSVLSTSRVIGSAYAGSGMGLISGTWRIMGLCDHKVVTTPITVHSYIYLAIRIS